MKKQFSIKPAQLLKAIASPVAKSESSNVLNFAFGKDVCCKDYMLITGLSKPAVSL